VRLLDKELPEFKGFRLRSLSEVRDKLQQDGGKQGTIGTRANKYQAAPGQGVPARAVA